MMTGQEFEQMSAVYDGELEGALDCPETLRAFQLIREAALAEAHPLPADFADKVTLQITRLPAPNPFTHWLKRMLPRPDLVSAELLMKAAPFNRALALLAVLAYLLPSLPILVFSELQQGQMMSNLEVFYTVATLGLMVGIPLYLVGRQAFRLMNMVRGRIFDDVVAAGLEPAPFLDGLAALSLKRAAPPLLYAFLGLFPVAALSGNVPYLLQWLPLTLAFLLAASYTTQLACIWAHRSGGLLRGLGWMVPAIVPPLVLGGVFADRLYSRPGWWVVSSLWISFFSRWGACRGVRAEAGNGGSQQRWFRAFTENPIVLREAARFQSRFPGGRWSYVLGRSVMLSWPGLLLLSLLADLPHYLTAWGALLIGSAVFFLRAAWGASELSARERGADLGVLIGTGIGSRTYVNGVAAWSLSLIFSEWLVLVTLVSLGAFLAPTTLGTELAHAEGWLAALALGLLPLGAGLAGAFAGQAGGGRVSVFGQFLKLAVIYLSVTLLSTFVIHGGNFSGDPEEIQHILLLAGTWPPLFLTCLGSLFYHASGAYKRGAILWSSGDTEEPDEKAEGRMLLVTPTVAAVFFSWWAGMLASGVAKMVWFYSLPGAFELPLFLGCAAWTFLLLTVFLGPLVSAAASRACRGQAASVGLSVGFAVLGSFFFIQAQKVQPVLGRLSEMDRSFELYPVLTALLVGYLFGRLAQAQAGPSARPLPWPAAWQQVRLGLLLMVPVLVGAVTLVLQSRQVYVFQPELAERVRAETSARWVQRAAVPPDQNALVDLEPYIGAGKPRTETFKSLSERYRQLRLEEPRPRTAEFDRARQGLSAMLPVLRSALEKPEFATEPLYGVGAEAKMINFIAVRDLSRGLNVLAHEALAEGRLEEALEHTLMGLRFSELFTGRGGSIQEMVGVAVHGVAMESALELGGSGKLNASQRARLLAALEQTRYRRQNLVMSMDYEYESMQRVFERAARDPHYRKSLTEEMETFAFIPGWHFETEQKAHSNAYLSLRRYLEYLRPGRLELRLRRAAEGRLAAALIPSTHRMVMNFSLVFTRQEALKTILALEAFHERYQRYPTRLEDLVPEFLEALPRDAMNSEGRFFYVPTSATYLLRGVPNRFQRESITFK